MTLLPSHDAKDRPDLPAYELGPLCQVKGCGLAREPGGGHHIWRRSFGTRSWWVELSDGALVPNRAGLCWQHHLDLTGDIGGHKAEIVLRQGRLFYSYIGQEGNEVRLKFDIEQFDDHHQLTVDGGSVPHEQVVASHHDGLRPGSTCTSCKRRIPYPKKKDSPKTKVAAVRIPIGDVEAWEEALDAAAEHLGVKHLPHHKFHTLNAGLVLILQGEAGLLG